jgi:outer membrane protein OmpA-like peptidoglycan-associated protein
MNLNIQKYHLTIWMLLASNALLSQLIKNGSFEQHMPTKCLGCMGRNAFGSFLSGWEGDVNWQPIVCDCSYRLNEDEIKYGNCPKEIKPFAGCSMVQLDYVPNCLDWNHENRGNGSYLSTSFTTPLQVGQTYEVTAQIYIPARSQHDFTRNIGIMFYPKKVFNPAGKLLEGAPFTLQHPIEYDKWLPIKWRFTATCELKQMVIGVFRNAFGPPIGFTAERYYYFIDDVHFERVQNTPQGIAINYFCRYQPNAGQASAPELEPLRFLFDTGSDALSPTDTQTLKAFCDAIEPYPATTFTISGHTDAIGNDHAALAAQRIKTVLAYLNDVCNVKSHRFIQLNYADRLPFASNDTEEGRKQNRCVEIKLSVKKRDAVLYRNIIETVVRGDTENAAKMYTIYLQIATESDALMSLYDPRIAALRTGKESKNHWAMVRKRYQHHALPLLAFQLDSLWAEDQYGRTLDKRIENLSAWVKHYDQENRSWDVLFEESDAIMAAKDSVHLAYLKGILKNQKIPFPTFCEVGEHVAKGAFLVIQHSNELALFRSTVSELHKLCLIGESSWLWYATMYDRLCIMEGKKQRFGTQYKPEEEPLELFPLQEPDSVTVWRQRIGLVPVNGY